MLRRYHQLDCAERFRQNPKLTASEHIVVVLKISSSTPLNVTFVELDVSHTPSVPGPEALSDTSVTTRASGEEVSLMVSPITSPTLTVTTQASEEEVPPITSPAPAYPTVAQNHANRHSDVHRFESREAAEEFMGSTVFQTYNTSDNSYLSVFGERIYKVYTDGGYGVWFGENHPDNVAASLRGGNQCSQQAELQALVDAYRITCDRQDGRIYEIHCDCQTAIDLVNISCLNYCRFRSTVDKIRQYKQRSNATIFLLRVLGHNGDPGNERAHYLANMGRKSCFKQDYPCVNGALRHLMGQGTSGPRVWVNY
ncbi:hypothetical protein LXG23DRAFT_52853 [Yarrowia lipolytica]|nr:hypothetical protein LXG23DRAFT_52853 [Yarrowia lipolytica]